MIGLRNLNEAERATLKMMADLGVRISFRDNSPVASSLDYLVEKHLLSVGQDGFYQITEDGLWAIGIDPNTRRPVT